MASDLITAAEAGKLLAGRTEPFKLWLQDADGDWRITSHDTPMKRRRVVATCGYDRDEAALLAAAPTLARTVIALEADLAALRIEHGAVAGLLTATRVDRDEARVERDRLRSILRCEQGEWAPEGWTRASKFNADWECPRTDMRVDQMAPGRWQAFRWTGQEERLVGDEFTTALECIEAADLAAKEKA